MTPEQRAVLQDIDLWLSLLVNIWLIVGAIIFALTRPGTWQAAAQMLRGLAVYVLISVVGLVIILAIQFWFPDFARQVGIPMD